MVGVAEVIVGQSSSEGRQARETKSLAPVQSYALAVFSVAVALGGALLLRHFGYRDVQASFFLFAVAVTAWCGGARAAVLALLLSCVSFVYFFVEPRYTFFFTLSDVPYFVLIAAFASLITWFSAVRRRVEQDLRQSRDELEREVAVRTQQASLLDLTHDTIFVSDMDDVITFWNRGAQELYGWTAEEAVGKRAHELLHTVFPAPAEEIRAELLRTGRWDGELAKTKADGTRVVVSSRWSLRRDEQGRPAAVLATNNDITEQRQREQQIRALNEDLSNRSAELEASNKELEAFAYSVSHDLRAPVRHIAGFTELLQKHAQPVLDHKSRHHIATILDSATRMGNLVDDLLAFSRIGRAETQKTTVKLEQLVKAVMADSAPDAQGRTIDWKIGELPICHGDPAMLRLVVSNLISNALKFTRTRGQVRIEIGSLNHRPEEVVFFVKDNGVGFDMKYKDKLFGVFQRLHSQEAFEGTGIGLATVQRIVQRHGGRVWAEAAIDQGATFYVALPKAQQRNV